MARSIFASVLACALMIGLAGCSSHVTADNFAKLKSGMTPAEVESVLGKPSEDKSAGASVGGMSIGGGAKTWKDGDKTITVTFVNDKVTLFTKSGF